MNIQISKNIFNSVFLPYLWDTTPVQIFFGGASSGKSIFLSDRFVLMNARDGRNILVIRNVAATLRTTCFTEICKSIAKFKLNNIYEISLSTMTITNRLNNSQFIFRGLDDVEKLKSITTLSGPISVLWVEEATEISESNYNQLSLRLRGKLDKPKIRILSFNPVTNQHWIKKRFFDGYNEESGELISDNILIHHSTHKDNNFLTQDDHENIEAFKNIDEYFYNVYALGKWGVLGSLIFTNWRTADLSEMFNVFDEYYNGCDFGFTNDATCILRCSKKNRTIYILEERYGKGWTNPTIAELAFNLIGTEDILFCDSAEPKSIAELRNDISYSINAMPVKKGKDSVIHGIQWLQQHEIIIDYRCQNTINEFTNYQWTKDKNGNSINVPIGINDHSIAALRYAFERLIGFDSPILRGSADTNNNTEHEENIPILSIG